MSPTKQAWRTTAVETTSIVAAETRGKAIGITMRAAREVGYQVVFFDVRAVRAPEHNEWAKTQTAERCWAEEYLPGAGKGERSGED